MSTDETTSGSRADIVIVGYGPVGQTLAALLGHQGHDVVVLERQTAMYTRPRAITLDNEVTRVLAGIGIGSYFEEFCLPSWQYDWQNAEGQTLIHFEFGNEPGSGRPLNVTFHQPSLEARLIELVATLPSVEVRRGATVVDVVERDDDVVVTYETADGHRQAVSATYVVGCDGANSRVREALAPEIEDRGFFYDWAVLDVPGPHPTTSRPPARCWTRTRWTPTRSSPVGPSPSHDPSGPHSRRRRHRRDRRQLSRPVPVPWPGRPRARPQHDVD